MDLKIKKLILGMMRVEEYTMFLGHLRVLFQIWSDGIVRLIAVG